MDIKVIASGSSGNCYRVDDGQTSVLLEAGVPIKRIKDALGYDLSDIAACLITHEHGDHAKSARSLAARTIDVYATAGTFKAMGVKKGHRFKPIKPREQFEIGTLSVMPFETKHDAAEPVGFLIQSNATNERLLYVTDTHYVAYDFKGVNYLMVECNYSEDMIRQNIHAETIPASHAKRVYTSHMGLKGVKTLLERIDTSQMVEIWLLHLSDANSNEKRMLQEIRQQTGVVVRVAAS